VAVDATTGKELWVHRFAIAALYLSRFGRESRACAARTTGRVRIERTAAFSCLQEAFLQALDARTGELVDSFADHGKLDLKIGIGPGYQAAIPRGRQDASLEHLILGSATGEGYLAPRAISVPSMWSPGKLLWVFHTIPPPLASSLRHVAQDA